MMCIIFPITVRLLQNNERCFPLIFTITVVELVIMSARTDFDHAPFCIIMHFNFVFKDSWIPCTIPDSNTSLAQCHFLVGWVNYIGPTMAQRMNNDRWRYIAGP
jgi:hypothetical protein